MLLLIFILSQSYFAFDNDLFVRVKSGKVFHSFDELGEGIFLSLNLLRGIRKNWFIGIELNEYFRKKVEPSGIGIPEEKIIEDWLDIFSLQCLFSWGREYPQVMLRIGGCYIYGKRVVLRLGSPYPSTSFKKEFSPVFDIELSDVLWLPKIPVGITIGVNGGVIPLKRFYGGIGAGIIYKYTRP